MANPSYTTISITGTGVAAYYPDIFMTPFDLSYAVEVPGGVTTSWMVEYTLDDPNDLTWTPVWLPDPTNSTAQTASGGGYYNGFRIQGLRVSVTVLSGGNIRFVVLTGMSSR